MRVGRQRHAQMTVRTQFNDYPASTTNRTPGTVTDVSAIFVHTLAHGQRALRLHVYRR